MLLYSSANGQSLKGQPRTKNCWNVWLTIVLSIPHTSKYQTMESSLVAYNWMAEVMLKGCLIPIALCWIESKVFAWAQSLRHKHLHYWMAPGNYTRGAVYPNTFPFHNKCASPNFTTSKMYNISHVSCDAMTINYRRCRFPDAQAFKPLKLNNRLERGKGVNKDSQ